MKTFEAMRGHGTNGKEGIFQVIGETHGKAAKAACVEYGWDSAKVRIVGDVDKTFKKYTKNGRPTVGY